MIRLSPAPGKNDWSILTSTMDTIWLELTLISLGILLNGFLSGSEFALVSARVSRLAQMAISSPGAAVVIRLKQNPESYLATIQIGITLVGTLASAVGGATAVEALTPALAALGAGPAAAPLGLGLVIIAITFVSLVFGELVPKAVALRHPEVVASAVARPILLLSRASSGLVWLLTASTSAVLRLTGLGRIEQSTFISEDEVRYLVREGTARGIFEKSEEELVHNVFEFGDTTVREIMVPRPQVLGLDVNTPGDELVRHAAAIGHSRVPVYRESIEHPVGILMLKDLLRALAEEQPLVLAALIHPPLFVPETAKISVVLREFQLHRQQLALVVDEYGIVAGLVTVEDIVEEIVGDIREEGAAGPRPGIVALPDGALLVDGLTPLDELRAAGLAVEESRDYTTAAGVVIAALNAIPAAGASFVRSDYRWTVVEAQGPRVTRIRIERV